MTDDNVKPTPDLADIPMKAVTNPASGDERQTIAGDDPGNPPAEDVTLPTE